MRTQHEIDTEISTLRGMRPQVPARTDFCDDSRRAIDAEITTLDQRLSINEILDRNEMDQTHPEYFSDEERDCAIEARIWLDGGGFESPSECWAHYIL